MYVLYTVLTVQPRVYFYRPRSVTQTLFTTGYLGVVLPNWLEPVCVRVSICHCSSLCTSCPVVVCAHVTVCIVVVVRGHVGHLCARLSLLRERSIQSDPSLSKICANSRFPINKESSRVRERILLYTTPLRVGKRSWRS
jgi:hypothetical protein